MMHANWRRASASCVLAALLAVPGVAAQADTRPITPVSVSIDALVEKTEKAPNGTLRTVLVPPASAPPGTEVIYRLTVRNDGAKAADGLEINNPVPPQMALTAADAAFLSVDGKTFGALTELVVVEAGASRAATLGDVTHVRWIVDSLAPGADHVVSFRARVD
jgi:uncharacterized repeat protein (TIGR01451 family)